MPVDLSPVIKFGGAPLATAWLDALLECRVRSEFQMPAEATLRFTDPGYVLSSASTAALGTSVSISIQGGGPLIEGEVTGLSVEQRESEQPELIVTAHDKSHRMGRGSRVATYLKSTYADVVTQLVNDYGLSASCDVCSTADYLLQMDTDLAFITELADRIGFDWWVEGDTLNFKKPAAGSTVALELHKTLRSFSVRATGHHPGTAEVYGWDRNNQQQLSGSSTTPTLEASSALAEKVKSPDSSFGSAKAVVAGLGGQTSDEVNTLSQALMDRLADSSVIARGTADASASIKLGASAHVTGAGPLNGTYSITKVEHVYRPQLGFYTRFATGDRRPTSLASGGANGNLAALLGPATYHPGVVVGQVTNINDPDHSGKVKVRYPGLSDKDESNWGRLLSMGGGSSRGSVFIPEVGDEVLVAFESGDPRQPVILGGLYGSKSTIPEWTVKDGAVESRAFTSRLGHVMSMSDGETDADQFLLLQLAGKQHTIQLGKTAATFKVPSGVPLTIQAGDSQVAISDSGDITVKGVNITIQAQANLKLSGAQVSIEADSTLQMSANATAALKANATLSLEGTAQASLKGGIVQIN
jgi:uncharacterized protein involved in type VI secretion and phage assembly